MSLLLGFSSRNWNKVTSTGDRNIENRVLSGIFGPKRELHNEELHNLCSSSRMMKWAGHVRSMGQKQNAYRILVECQKERPLGRQT
jgi:hypothetical protein